MRIVFSGTPATLRGYGSTPRFASLSVGSAVVSSLVGTGRRVGVLELELFLVQFGVDADALELPRRDVAEVLVVAERLAVIGLVLLAEVPAAALVAVECVAHEQLPEFEEVGHAAGLL